MLLMKPLPITPGRRELCPKDCKYRAREVPFCGFCLARIRRELGIDKREEDSYGKRENRSGQDQSKDS